MLRGDIPVKDRILLDVHQRVMAHKMVESWDNVPHAAIAVDLDVTDVLAFVERLSGDAAFEGVRVTINSVMLKIIAEAMRTAPELNAHVEYDKRYDFGRLSLCEDVNVAVPFLSGDGRMMTPVMRQVDKKPLRQICLDARALRRRVRNTNLDYLLYEAAMADTIARLKRLRLGVLRRVVKNFVGKHRVPMPTRRTLRDYHKIPERDRITVEELLSATTLVSNVGSVMPGLRARINLLEIMPPQVTAIGLSAVRKQPVVVTDEADGDSIQIRSIMPLSLCIDHRVLDFSHVRGFLQTLLDVCQHPERLCGGG